MIPTDKLYVINHDFKEFFIMGRYLLFHKTFVPKNICSNVVINIRGYNYKTEYTDYVDSR